MQKMVWNVYYENFNGREIQSCNIFDHYSFSEDVKKIYKKYKDDFDTFSKEIKSSLMYYFWSKAEWEIIIGPWCGQNRIPDAKIKVDVYDQVMLNWDIFINYVWDQCHARKTPERKKNEKS